MTVLVLDGVPRDTTRIHTNRKSKSNNNYKTILYFQKRLKTIQKRKKECKYNKTKQNSNNKDQPTPSATHAPTKKNKITQETHAKNATNPITPKNLHSAETQKENPKLPPGNRDRNTQKQ